MANKGVCVSFVIFYSMLLCAATICLFFSAYDCKRFAGGVYAAKEAESAEAPFSAKKFTGFHDPKDMALRTVRFSVSAPAAQSVLLHADFNMWGAQEAELKKDSSGAFSKTVVLPQGEYKYYYLIDGAHKADVREGGNLFYNGREMSIKKVL
ncbi:MAG: hypothetical protein LBG46_02755 [Elusimicrobiota bacterium]|jgi:hypothetical protein|nr:hypothetical protein [Elusimicrobiota bacterium]